MRVTDQGDFDGWAVDSWATLAWAWLGLGVTVALLAVLTAAAVTHRRRGPR